MLFVGNVKGENECYLNVFFQSFYYTPQSPPQYILQFCYSLYKIYKFDFRIGQLYNKINKQKLALLMFNARWEIFFKRRISMNRRNLF